MFVFYHGKKKKHVFRFVRLISGDFCTRESCTWINSGAGGSILTSQLQGSWFSSELGLLTACVDFLFVFSGFSGFLPPPKDMPVGGLAKITRSYVRMPHWSYHGTAAINRPSFASPHLSFIKDFSMGWEKKRKKKKTHTDCYKVPTPETPSINIK